MVMNIRVITLNPFLDKNDFMRAGGLLGAAGCLS